MTRYGSQICLTTFISSKIIELLKTQQPLKLKKKYTDLEFLVFKEMFMLKQSKFMMCFYL
jgi:hypothetical protein